MGATKTHFDTLDEIDRTSDSQAVDATLVIRDEIISRAMSDPNIVYGDFPEENMINHGFIVKLEARREQKGMEPFWFKETKDVREFREEMKQKYDVKFKAIIL